VAISFIFDEETDRQNTEHYKSTKLRMSVEFISNCLFSRPAGHEIL